MIRRSLVPARPLAALLGAAALLAVALLPLARPAAAQQAPRDTTRLDPVVVTATRTAAPRSAVPSSVTVLDADDLAGRGVRLLVDALRAVPGLAVVQNGSVGAAASVFLRGGESDYVKVLVDGVPVNQPGGSFDWSTLTTDNVERVEIVRGPSSVLYGTDAVTGVVQIFTRRGRGQPTASVGVEGGSLGTVRVGADLAGSANGLAYSGEIARFTTDGALPVNNAYENLVASARLFVRPDARSDLALAVRGGDATYRFPTNSAGVVADSNQFTTARTTTVSLDAGRQVTDRVEVRLTGGLFAATNGFDDRKDNAADTTGFGFASRRTGTVRRYAFDARTNVVAWPGATVTVGAALEQEREEQLSQTTSNFGGVATSSGAFDAKRTNVGAYAQLATPLVGRALLTAGVRLDDNEVFGNFVTYRGGVSVPFATGTRVRGSVGNAFKAPTFSEQFAATSFEVGNPALEPERSTSWEAAVEQDLLGGRVTLVGIAFGQRFRDLIQYRGASTPGAPTYVNLAEATSDGFEAEVRARVLATLDLTASASWLDTEVTDAGASPATGGTFENGQPLVRRPARTLSASARWRPLSRLALGAVVNHVGERADIDFRTFPSVRTTLGSYTTWDLDASAELVPPAGLRPRVTGTLRVQNAFDAAYEPIVGFRAPGRVTLIGIRVGG